MLTLNQEIAIHKATRNITALNELSESIQDTVKYTKAWLQETLDNPKYPKYMAENATINLAQAENNLMLVQNTLNSILKR